ncbi:MAG: molybdopterin-binding protein [Candidatus Methanomethyliaceae archaeon]|nr:molybdopterin-binding protein [Candidatus Methanomethyliaceae archaeon]
MIISEIISIGRELLIGRTQNTNAVWISSQLISVGIEVSRISIVGDSVYEISRAVSESLARSPSILITTGGLGPTYDDLTVEGIASALKIPKALNPEALEQVERKYRSMGLEMTPSRYKMAVLLEGAKPLLNNLGTAPGMMIKYKDTTIFSLPGVPSEMMEMFSSQVLNKLLEKVPRKMFLERVLIIEGIPESSLAPLIEEWLPHSGGVYLKSHPAGREPSPTLKIHLSIIGENFDEMDSLLSRAEDSFTKYVLKVGGRIKGTQK